MIDLEAFRNLQKIDPDVADKLARQYIKECKQAIQNEKAFRYKYGYREGGTDIIAHFEYRIKQLTPFLIDKKQKV